jgi:hypothetical protein
MKRCVLLTTCCLLDQDSLAKDNRASAAIATLQGRTHVTVFIEKNKAISATRQKFWRSLGKRMSHVSIENDVEVSLMTHNESPSTLNMNRRRDKLSYNCIVDRWCKLHNFQSELCRYDTFHLVCVVVRNAILSKSG